MPAEPAYVPPMAVLMTANELLGPHIPERAELVCRVQRAAAVT
jgi:hypothetical protein